MKKKLLLSILLLLSALIVAFFLQDVVEQLIIRPAAYILWLLGLFYRYIPQPVLWVFLVLILVSMVMVRLIQQFNSSGSPEQKRVQAQGPVSELAWQIQNRRGGIYFKWQIARTLSQIARDVQDLRQHILTRRLDFDGKAVSPEVQAYLEAGFNTSFSDYPLPRSAFLHLPTSHRHTTPLDIGIQPVIEYLESEMENNDDLRRA